MKAVIFEKQGLDNLHLKEDVDLPTMTEYDVLIKVRAAGVNPLDYITISSLGGINPLPHIPGVEISGIVTKIGKHVTSLKEGDRVVLYNRIFDGTCDMCLDGNEMLCRNGKMIGVNTNGGFTEYIAAPERNAFKIPDDVGWDVATSLPTTTITPYHALREASLKLNEFLVFFWGLWEYGHNGNTIR
jgi:D-arabinose 1-dehydrogenase-like Zn-dependent alcohol dehydrogenase